MNESLQAFCRWFWIALGLSIFYGALFFVITRRRHLWLRIMDAEESFWLRFGLPKGGFFRRVGESRFFTISMALFSLMFLVLATVSASLYFYYRKRLQ